MNSCILIAQITEAPQLRYTQDNQMAIAEMKVQFAALRPEEAIPEIKVIGWGNLAQEIVQKYQTGDQVVIEGRLGMQTVERPEGFKEKRAELTVSKMYPLSGMDLTTPAFSPAVTAPTGTTPTGTTPTGTTPTSATVPAAASMGATTPKATVSKATKKAAPVVEEPDFDEIPF
jgi:single-strand DNA-binding protein